MALTAKKLEAHSKDFVRSNSQTSQSEMSASQASRSQSQSPRTARSTASGAAARSSDMSENVKVVCRVRPFGRREIELQDEMNAKKEHDWEKQPLRSVIDISGNTTLFLDHEKEYALRQKFEFDISIWSIPQHQQTSDHQAATQEDVYQLCGAPVIRNIWTGYNTCMFAYGQTGSGKTFTMMGTEEEPGLIPRMCKDLFDELSRRRADEEARAAAATAQAEKDGTPPPSTHDFRLEARFLEIYNERVKDLLWALRKPEVAVEGSPQGKDADPQRALSSPRGNEQVDKENLKIRLVPNVGPVVVGLTCVSVDCWEDCQALINEGTRNRAVAATKMNDQSSRSHSIFRLTLVQTTKVPGETKFEKPKYLHRTSVVSLVDLAGSERNKKTGAEGARLKEAVAINQSLTSLKNVIDALVEGRKIVPYRDSTLTWLLSDNLGGNSKTYMIACVSPHLDNAEETLNTLRYAMRTQAIVNHATVNESEELRRMSKMREEMERLQDKLNDTGEEELLRQRDENLEGLQALSKKNDARLAAAKELEKHLVLSEDMRFGGVFSHAFKKACNERIEAGLRTQLIRLEHEFHSLQRDVETMERDASTFAGSKANQEREEALAREQRNRLEDECHRLAGRNADLEQTKQDLLKADETNGERIQRKIPLLVEARNIARVQVMHTDHVWSLKRAAHMSQCTNAMEAVKAKQEALDVEAKHQRESRLKAARQKEESLRRQIADARARKEARAKELNQKAARLHSKCIFEENEYKRAGKDNDEAIVSTNRNASARFHEDEAEWKRRIEARQNELRGQNQRTMQELCARTSNAEVDHKRDAKDLAERTEKEIEEVHKVYNEKTDRVESDSRAWLKSLTSLVDDTRFFIRDANATMPRYGDSFAKLSAFVNGEGDPPPADKAKADQRLRKALREVVIDVQSYAPSAYRCEDFETSSAVTARTNLVASEPPPVLRDDEDAPPRQQPPPGENGGGTSSHHHHSSFRSVSQQHQMTSPRRKPSSPFQSASPSAHQSASAARDGIRPSASSSSPSAHRSLLPQPQQPQRADVQVKALRPPTLKAQETRTQLLRCSRHNYKKIPQATAIGSPAPGRPAPSARSDRSPPASARNAQTSPAAAESARSRSPSATVNTPPATAPARQQRIGVGGTYFLSRSKSPTAASRR